MDWCTTECQMLHDNHPATVPAAPSLKQALQRRARLECDPHEAYISRLRPCCLRTFWKIDRLGRHEIFAKIRSTKSQVCDAHNEQDHTEKYGLMKWMPVWELWRTFCRRRGWRKREQFHCKRRGIPCSKVRETS